MFIQSEKNTAASKTTTVPTAITIFCIILLAVFCVKPNACGKRLISEFISTTSDVSIATSVPLPIAIPMSASARDGLSFTPSPTNATICPSACSFCKYADLSSGNKFPCASVKFNSSATRSTVPWLSPDRTTKFFTPNCFRASKSSFTPGRIWSRIPIKVFNSPSTAVRTSEFPRFS